MGLPVNTRRRGATMGQRWGNRGAIMGQPWANLGAIAPRCAPSGASMDAAEDAAGSAELTAESAVVPAWKKSKEKAKAADPDAYKRKRAEQEKARRARLKKEAEEAAATAAAAAMATGQPISHPSQPLPHAPPLLQAPPPLPRPTRLPLSRLPSQAVQPLATLSSTAAPLSPLPPQPLEASSQPLCSSPPQQVDAGVQVAGVAPLQNSAMQTDTTAPFTPASGRCIQLHPDLERALGGEFRAGGRAARMMVREQTGVESDAEQDVRVLTMDDLPAICEWLWDQKVHAEKQTLLWMKRYRERPAEDLMDYKMQVSHLKGILEDGRCCKCFEASLADGLPWETQ